MAKEALSLKLETPYMLAASALGLLSVSCVLPGDGPFRTPLEGLSTFFAWTGWSSPATWFNTGHEWMTEAGRIEAAHGLFVLLALFGTVFASYSRASFASLVGVSGLVETGSATQAWLLPVSVLVAMVVAGRVLRPWNEDLWERAGWTCFWMLMALGYCIIMAIVFVFGEQRSPDRPQPVELELSLETRLYIDKRLNAFGMRDLNPPVSIPAMVPSAATNQRLAQVYREQKIERNQQGAGTPSGVSRLSDG